MCDALLGGALFSDRLRGEVEALEARLNASEGRLAVIVTIPVPIAEGGRVTVEVPVDGRPRRRTVDADQEVIDTCETIRRVGGSVVLAHIPTPGSRPTSTSPRCASGPCRSRRRRVGERGTGRCAVARQALALQKPSMTGGFGSYGAVAREYASLPSLIRRVPLPLAAATTPSSTLEARDRPSRALQPWALVHVSTT